MIFHVKTLSNIAKNVVLVGGDGRYYNTETAYTILGLACANGISEVHVPKYGVMSTPACSAYIRAINEEQGNCIGGILLTASHNPGGPEHDFGIKFNGKNGGPAPEEFTDTLYIHTLKIEDYKTADFNFKDAVSLDEVAEYTFTHVNRPLKRQFKVKIVDNVAPYINLMKKLFDFPKLTQLFQRKDFTFQFDGLHGVSGPYAKAIFVDELKGNPASLKHCDVLPDFGGLHPDPNLTYAEDLVKAMGIFDKEKKDVPEFGAACDGDAGILAFYCRQKYDFGKTLFRHPFRFSGRVGC
jgi:phosphoglucomutase